MELWQRLKERWAIWDCPAVFVFLFLLSGGLLAWSLLLPHVVQ